MAENKLQNLKWEWGNAHKSKWQKLKRMGKIRNGELIALRRCCILQIKFIFISSSINAFIDLLGNLK